MGNTISQLCSSNAASRRVSLMLCSNFSVQTSRFERLDCSCSYNGTSSCETATPLDWSDNFLELGTFLGSDSRSEFNLLLYTCRALGRKGAPPEWLQFAKRNEHRYQRLRIIVRVVDCIKRSF